MTSAFVAALLDRVERLLSADGAAHDRPAISGGTLFLDECRALGDDPRIADSLAIVAAPHLDPSIRDIIARAWGHPARRHVDGALLLKLLSRSRDDLLALAEMYADDGPLHRAGLVESIPASLAHHASPLEQELIPTPRLMHLLHGRIGVDARLRRFSTTIPAAGEHRLGVLSAERFEELALLVARAAGNLPAGAQVIIAGAAGTGKLRLALALASAGAYEAVLVVESAFLPTDPVRLVRILETLAHEAATLGAVLLFRRIENLVDGPRVAALVRHALAKLDATVWITTDVDLQRQDVAHLMDLATLRLFLPYPDTALRQEAWHHELASAGVSATPDLVKVLAAEYPLPRSAIETVARLASGGGTVEDLPRLAESQMRGQLARFARRSRNRARFENLVLGESTKEQVVEVLEAARRRTLVMDQWGLTERHASGRGIVAMFNGPPGTGKTLAANVIANELALPLYRIDVSQIVDRYVGETEKNLTAMFDEAAACRAALLFDEADSLFGKRIDAKDATDRFANMQINLLLNLIEDYDGFVVLTTNLKQALDTAFMRRIAYKVVFDMPEYDERVALWEYHLPAAIPRAGDVDVAALAEEFDGVAGGDIKNVVLRAALAAGGTRPVTQHMLRQSMINELRANGAVVAERGAPPKHRGGLR